MKFNDSGQSDILGMVMGVIIAIIIVIVMFFVVLPKFLAALGFSTLWVFILGIILLAIIILSLLSMLSSRG